MGRTILRLLSSLLLGLGLTLGLLGLLGSSPVRPAYATSFGPTVFTDTIIADDGACTLRESIINTNNDDQSGSTDCPAGSGDDTIILAAGTHTLTLTGTGEDAAATGDLDITDTNALTITGAGAGQTIINANGIDRVLDIRAGTVVISGVTIYNGAGVSTAGGISSSNADITLINTIVYSSWASFAGGGVYVHSGSATLMGSQVLSNSSKFGGGMYIAFGSAMLTGTQVASNFTTLDGSGVYLSANSARLSIDGGMINNNFASDDGGGVYVSSGSALLTGTQVISNSASDDGGGVYVETSNATLSMDGGIINNNLASFSGGGLFVNSGNATLKETQVFSNLTTFGFGGGIGIDYGNVTLTETQIRHNSSASTGGGMYVGFGSTSSAVLNMTGGDISNNSGRLGGGISFSSGKATLTGTQVFSNSAYLHGGGMYIYFGSAMLIDAQVFSNSASNTGGGMYISSGSAMLIDTQVLSNSASNIGGGVYVDSSSATLRATRGDISNNSTTSDGGGVYINSGSVVLTGTQVVSNSSSPNKGGGVYVNLSDATLSMDGGIINDNSGSYGGGVYINSGRATLTGTQISRNSASTFGGGVHVNTSSAVLSMNGGEISNSLDSGIYVNFGSAILTRTQIFSNSASSGSGLYIFSGSATLIETQILSNTATSDGGGMHVDFGNVTLEEGEINNNRGPVGGGVYLNSGSVVLTGTHILRNSASNGGAFYLAFTGGITATDGCIVDNSDTAVVRNDGTLNASDNWWGAVDGPSGNGLGSGDSVSANVDFSNFKTSPPLSCITGPQPEIELQGNGQSIPNDSLVPSIANDTDFGSTAVAGGTAIHTFTISNSGTVDLTLTGTPAVTLTNSAHFSVTTQPSSPVISNSTTTFVVTFDPSTAGMVTDTVNLSNNAWDKNPYSFVISGTGTVPVLSIGKSAQALPNNASATYHSLITYTVTLTNSSDLDALGALFTDTLPTTKVDFARFISPPTPGDASQSGDEITWSGMVTAGQTITFSYVVTHVGDYNESVNNNAQFLLPTTNQSDMVSTAVTIASAPDLAIDKTANPVNAASGEMITYTLHFSNAGSTLATGVIITDQMPITYLTSIISSTDFVPTKLSIIDNNYVWQIGTLNGSTEGTITMSGKISDAISSSTIFTNTAEISGTTFDSNTGNNFATASVTVSGDEENVYLPIIHRK